VLSFSEIRVDGGVVALRDAERTFDEALEDVELSLAWPSIAKSFGATGRFSWHNENVDVSLAVADFPAALIGETSGLKFRFGAGPIKTAFDGTMSYLPSLKIDGTLAADAVSLRDALRWGGGRSLPGGGLGRFALKAHAVINSATIALSSLNIELDGNVAEGALSYSTTGRGMLQGTLAVEKLDLSPYASAIRLSADNAREWDTQSLNLDWFNGWDADLRLSAATVHFTRSDLGRSVVAANLRSGRLVVTILDSQSYHGSITGRISIGNVDGTAEIKSQMQFANVDLEKCLSDLFGIRHLEGTGNLSFSLEASGANVAEIVRNLNGNVLVSANKGALAGINVEQLLRRLKRSPLSNNADFRGGRTPFDKFNAGFRIVSGVATAEDVHLEGPGVQVVVNGTGSLVTRNLDFSGTASLVTAAADPNGSFSLPFVVQGSWENPLPLPDTQTLIQRSDATGPLIDALKDRRTRDAVRAAIERLTGVRVPDVEPR
jgi:AsmA protein